MLLIITDLVSPYDFSACVCVRVFQGLRGAELQVFGMLATLNIFYSRGTIKQRC